MPTQRAIKTKYSRFRTVTQYPEPRWIPTTHRDGPTSAASTGLTASFAPRDGTCTGWLLSSVRGEPALHDAEQVFGVHRLGDIVGGTGGDALIPVALHGPGGHRDDRQVSQPRYLPDRRRGRVPVH